MSQNIMKMIVGFKFQLYHTILIFWNKFPKKGYFCSKTEKMDVPLNSSYSNCSKYQISTQTKNFDFFGPNLPTFRFQETILSFQNKNLREKVICKV